MVVGLNSTPQYQGPATIVNSIDIKNMFQASPLQGYLNRTEIDIRKSFRRCTTVSMNILYETMCKAQILGSFPTKECSFGFGTLFKSQNFRTFLYTFVHPNSPKIWTKVSQNFWIMSPPPFFGPNFKKLVHKKCPKTFGLFRNPHPFLWQKSK